MVSFMCVCGIDTCVHTPSSPPPLLHPPTPKPPTSRGPEQGRDVGGRPEVRHRLAALPRQRQDPPPGPADTPGGGRCVFLGSCVCVWPCYCKSVGLSNRARVACTGYLPSHPNANLPKYTHNHTVVEPTVQDITEVIHQWGLPCVTEPHKRYPRDFLAFGRVRVCMCGLLLCGF